MKRFLLASLLVFIAVSTAASEPQRKLTDYLGRWDLTLQAPDGNYSSLLEIRERNGGIQPRMLGRWGRARLLPNATIKDGHIRLVSPKE